MPLPVTGLDVAVSEDGQSVLLFFEVAENWHATGFELPAPINPDHFDYDYYEG